MIGKRGFPETGLVCPKNESYPKSQKQYSKNTHNRKSKN